MDSFEDKIIELLSEYRNKSLLTPETTLQSLNMVSEEIDDFFEKYGKEFNIDGEGYNYYDYFLEQVHPLHVLRDFYYRIFNPDKIKKKELTIEHLAKVARNGKWLSPR